MWHHAKIRLHHGSLEPRKRSPSRHWWSGESSLNRGTFSESVEKGHPQHSRRKWHLDSWHPSGHTRVCVASTRTQSMFSQPNMMRRSGAVFAHWWVRIQCHRVIACSAKAANNLPLAIGGLGLRSAMKLRPTACWASWADAIKTITDRHPELEPSSVLSTRKLKPPTYKPS